MLRMSKGKEEMKAAIEVDSKTLIDPMVVQSLACPGSRPRT